MRFLLSYGIIFLLDYAATTVKQMMMKNRVVTLGLCAVAINAVANSGRSIKDDFEWVIANEKKVEIKIEDIPTSVSKSLAVYHSGAEVLKAYKWMDETDAVIGYEILLKKESGEVTVKFGPNGEPEK